jgi:hypothetical protein
MTTEQAGYYVNPFVTRQELQDDAAYNRELAMQTANMPKANLEIGDSVVIDGKEVCLVGKHVEGFAVMARLSDGREIYSAELNYRVAHGIWPKVERPNESLCVSCEVVGSVSLVGVFE